jgi:hypothetical protein
LISYKAKATVPSVVRSRFRFFSSHLACIEKLLPEFEFYALCEEYRVTRGQTVDEDQALGQFSDTIIRNVKHDLAE